MKQSAVILAYMCFSLSSFAQAEHNSKSDSFTGLIGVGVASSPEYLGSDDNELGAALIGKIHYGHYYAKLMGAGVQLNVSSDENIEYGLYLNSRSGRETDVENDTVSKLREIDSAFEVGLFVEFPYQNVFTKRDKLSFGIDVLTDVSGTHDGTVLKIGSRYSYMLSPKVMLSTGASLTYGDDSFNDTYFSVDSDNAMRSGLATYDADGGFNKVGLNVTANYALSKQWGMFGMVGYERLIGDAADSSIVADEGSDSMYRTALGLTYRF